MDTGYKVLVRPAQNYCFKCAQRPPCIHEWERWCCSCQDWEKCYYLDKDAFQGEDGRLYMWLPK